MPTRKHLLKFPWQVKFYVPLTCTVVCQEFFLNLKWPEEIWAAQLVGKGTSSIYTLGCQGFPGLSSGEEMV